VSRTAWLLSALAVLFGLLLGGYFTYENATYVSTDNAQVVAPAALVSAPVAGELTSFHLPVGARLAAGATVARVVGATGAPRAVRLRLAGTVTAAFAHVGDSVGAGQELGAVAALDRSVVVADIAEGQAGRVRVGQRVDLRFPDDPSPVRGTVERIGRASLAAAAQAGLPALTTANVTQYVPVTIRYRKGGLRIVDGMSASVRIHV